MIAAFIPAIAGVIGKIVDKAIPDKSEAERLKAQLTQQLLSLNADELKSATSIIVAEIQGGNWLQRNWRPIMMIWFAILVGMHWFGFTPENLSEAAVDKIFTIIQIGIGGYIVGRSGEKIVRELGKK